MVDTLVLGTSGESRVGSSPTWGTLKKIFDKTKTFRIIVIIIKTMRTSIKHMSSVIKQQELFCSWYRHVQNCSSEIDLG